MNYSYIADTQSQPFSLYDLHGLPTPNPSQAPHGADDLIAAALNYRNNEHGNSDNNAPFDVAFGLDPNTPLAQHQQPPPPHSPPESLKQSSENNQHSQNNSVGVGAGTDSLGRSSSEEKDGGSVDPNKRKAQNRAAQRAFRERKERHVRDLEQKVTDLEEGSGTLQADNEWLKHELARIATENEILRATSQHQNHNHDIDPHPGHQNQTRPSDEPTTTGPMVYKPLDFRPSTPGENSAAGPRHRIKTCPTTGEKLLDTGATWDYIQGHELFKEGLVDIGDVHEQLKKIAQCNGQGPAFPEGEVRRAVERSAQRGRDGL